MQRRKIPSVFCKKHRLSTAETVNTLLYVSYHKAIASTCDRLEDSILHAIDVLILVDVDVGVLFCVSARDLRGIALAIDEKF